jgi:hypothetical protein
MDYSFSKGGKIYFAVNLMIAKLGLRSYTQSPLKLQQYHSKITPSPIIYEIKNPQP